MSEQVSDAQQPAPASDIIEAVPAAEIAPCSSTSGTLAGSDVPRIS